MIRFVTQAEWGKLEGSTADMPWLVAKNRFVGFFADQRHGLGLYEQVEAKYGCRASNAKEWCAAMNSVITILNELSDDATESDVRIAFNI
ncbi:hypothetical protein ACFFU8_01230 [Chromobacterium piscinae]|uniref:hypothetical protein n=1 Tax=Chromobacterium piscinae TaxID=686831 RepID=UPI001E4139C1|nr:hypothetical protein [Chromobacterium piscinae]MCD5330670.1 hypothetical protein [Chromobacterium piscinae]